MKLREMMTRAVLPKIHERFSGIELSIPEFDDDDDDEASTEGLDEISSVGGLSLIIDYTDSKGNNSQRLITCRKLSVRAGKEYINAYCHHRSGPRSFRLDRIADIFDSKTGESLSPAQAFFANFEPDQKSESGFSWGLSAGRRADLIALLNALTFIARCDKEFHPSERDVLEKALTTFWLRLELPGDPDFDDILRYADRLAPDGETFWIAMHRFKEDPALADIFSQQANLLIQADGIIHENEAYWSVEIADFFAEND